MRRFLLVFSLFACLGGAATLKRIAAASPGGTDAAGHVWAPDAYFTGGSRWDATNQAALSALDLPYRALRYSTSGAVSYAIPAAAGDYVVTLYFEEPNKTGPGQRGFDVVVNGSTVKARLDVYAEAGGALKPYVLTVPVTSTGTITVKLVPTLGNALISGLQLDSIDPPPPPPPPPPVPTEQSCEDGMTTWGVGALFPGVNHLRGCENLSTAARQIVRARCRSDRAGAVLDVMAYDSAGLLQSLLSAPLPCAPEGAEVAGVGSYAPGTDLHWMIRINDSADPAVGVATFVTVAVVTTPAK